MSIIIREVLKLILPSCIIPVTHVYRRKRLAIGSINDLSRYSDRMPHRLGRCDSSPKSHQQE